MIATYNLERRQCKMCEHVYYKKGKEEIFCNKKYCDSYLDWRINKICKKCEGKNNNCNVCFNYSYFKKFLKSITKFQFIISV